MRCGLWLKTRKEIEKRGYALRTVVENEKGNSTHCLDTCYKSSVGECCGMMAAAVDDEKGKSVAARDVR